MCPARGNRQKKFFGYLSRGSGTKVSAGVARGDCTTRIKRISPRESGYGQFRQLGRSSPTWWSLQNRGSPRPRSRAKRGGRAPEAPKGGRRVPRRGDTTRPLDAKPAGGIRHFPRKTSRGTRPARPAGGGTNAFCFPSVGEPAPPRLPELSVTRPARGRFPVLPRYNHRAPHLRKLSFPDPRGCYALNPACLAPCATLAETPVPGSRGRRRVIFCVTFPARIFRFPMELRSPAPRALK